MDQGEISKYLNPQIDSSKSYNKGRLIFKKPKGPAKAPDGRMISRSIVGNQKLVTEGERLYQDRETREREERATQLRRQNNMGCKNVTIGVKAKSRKSASKASTFDVGNLKFNSRNKTQKPVQTVHEGLDEDEYQ